MLHGGEGWREEGGGGAGSWWAGLMGHWGRARVCLLGTVKSRGRAGRWCSARKFRGSGGIQLFVCVGEVGKRVHHSGRREEICAPRNKSMKKS